MTAEDGVRRGLRERKKQETRDALSLAAIQLSVERGWGSVTVEDIAAAADVSVRTFRNYFSNKAEAVAARHVDRMRRISAALRAQPVNAPLWSIIVAAVLEQVVPGHDIEGKPDHDRQHADGVRLMLSEPALQGEIAKASAVANDELAAAIAERTGTDPALDVYPKLLAASMGAAIGVAIEHWFQADEPVALGPVLRDALEQVAAGLPTP